MKLKISKDDAWVKINFSRKAESQSRLEYSFGELLKNGFWLFASLSNYMKTLPLCKHTENIM